MLSAYKFTPVPIERVWGGDRLARFGKSVPRGKPIGESWDLSDRPDVQSVVAGGPEEGRTLHQLIVEYGVKFLGANSVSAQRANAPALRFPILLKLLDARERLSLQVHPPPAAAAQLGGEPKTEMWYVLEAYPNAQLIAGLRRGVTREQFQAALAGQRSEPKAMSGAEGAKDQPSPLAALLHRIPVSAGDAFFVPSGRLHAIDAGLVLVEIQQNSDTTYRVFDWDRAGLDGQPRPLHVEQSLACIDFADFEPAKVVPRVEAEDGNGRWRLVECPFFHVHKLEIRNAWTERCDGSSFHLLTAVEGEAGLVTADGHEELLRPGESVLLPAAPGHYTLTPEAEPANVLKTFVPGPK